MTTFWIFYYCILILNCFLFFKFIKNKFIKFFFIPIIFGVFGSVWFTKPGSLEISPIISILFLESSIINSNGYERLIRPLISFIIVFQMISLVYYLFFSRKTKKK
tara:strand:- start:481 stop:795 length:315 start_codon:yes stop_codon:yes gene_type:complete